MRETYCGTWSIAALDAESGQLGIATASRALAVGAQVANVRPGVAAVCTQAWSRPALAPLVFIAIEAGATPEVAISLALEADDRPGGRQIAVVDRQGRTAVYTGSQVQANDHARWWGHVQGNAFVVAGNTLSGPEVVEATAERYGQLCDDEEQPFAARLLLALEAGEQAGGDRRGKQAAALLVSTSGPSASEYQPAVDLRVDDHTDPIAELKRIYRMAFPPCPRRP